MKYQFHYILHILKSSEGGRDLLVEHKVDEVLDGLKKHSEDIVKNKAVETEQILQSL